MIRSPPVDGCGKKRHFRDGFGEVLLQIGVGRKEHFAERRSWLGDSRPCLGVERASRRSLSHMYLTYIRPILEYACTAWGNLGTTQVDRLERFQRRAAKIILRRPLFVPSNHDELLATIGWPSLASRRKYFQAVLGYRMATSNVPQHLRDYIPSKPTHMHNTRKPPFFQLPTTNTSLMLNSPLYQAADTFNSLPAVLQSASSLTSFKNGAALFLLTCQCSCSKHTSK